MYVEKNKYIYDIKYVLLICIVEFWDGISLVESKKIWNVLIY